MKTSLLLFSILGAVNGFIPSGNLQAKTALVPTSTISFQPKQTVSSLNLSSISLPSPNPLESLQNGARSIVSKLKKSNEVFRWRAAAAMFLSALVCAQPLLDRQLARLWAHLMTGSSLAARIFRTDSYEWMLAVSCFGIFIHFFGYADRAVRRNPTHPWRKYRLQDRFEADKIRRKEDVENAEDKAAAVKVEHTPWNYKAWIQEFWVYVVPLLAWDILSPRRHRRLANFAAPTTFRIMRDVTCGLLIYDALFFFGHLAMHKIPFLYRRVHAKHHEVKEVRAGDIVRLSLAEEVMEVGYSIMALNAMSAHPVARSLYNIVIVFLLTELHCGFDFPWTPQNVIPGGLATGSRRHHYHHRNGRHYYQKFFFSFDRIFGFFQRNDGSVHGDSVQAKAYVPEAWK